MIFFEYQVKKTSKPTSSIRTGEPLHPCAGTERLLFWIQTKISDSLGLGFSSAKALRLYPYTPWQTEQGTWDRLINLLDDDDDDVDGGGDDDEGDDVAGAPT